MSAPIDPHPGAVVAWWRGNDLAFAVVVAAEKQRITLVGPGGREERVPGSRLAFEVERPGTVPSRDVEARREAGERAAFAEERARKLATGIDIAVVWELLRDSGRLVAETEIGDLALGARSPESRAAAIVALLADGVHFVRKQDGWEAREPEAVAEIQRQRETTVRRAEEKRRAQDALAAAATGAPFVATGSDLERRYLGALETLAILEDEAPEGQRELALEALEASHLAFERPHEGAFTLLRRTGRFASDDECLEIPRYGLRIAFPPETVAAAERAAARGFDRTGREDLTRLDIVTIDGPYTREIDDALGAEDLGDGRVRVSVHIADPSAFVTSGDPVDVEALARGTTHYFAERRVPMLPEPLCESAASLVAGEDRPALSFFADIEEDGTVSAWSVVPSVVRARARLSYDDADQMLTGGSRPFDSAQGRPFDSAQGRPFDSAQGRPFDSAQGRRFARALELLLSASRRREETRAIAGAIRLRTPEAEIHVGDDGTLTLERRDTGSPAHLLVSEAMVLAGELAARFCIERGIPAIYRRQAPPDGRPVLPTEVITDPVVAHAVRRTLRRATAGLEPGAHFALGLPAYTQATSPLRRFQDLAIHRQILAALRGGEPVYDAASLQRIAATTEAAEAGARRAERSRDRYWMLRWFAERIGERFTGTVVEKSPRPVVLLDATVGEEILPGVAGEIGDRVEVQVIRANPRARILVLR